MSSYAATIPRDSLKGPAVLSVIFHAAIFTAVGFLTYHHQGENWGGPGGSISVGLVGSVPTPAVPMPPPDIVSESRVVDETKGLYKSEPPPPPIVEKEAVPIPKFEKNKPEPKYVSKPSKLLENKQPPPPNAVPYGKGGSPNVPYSMAQPTMNMGNATQGGMAFGANGGAAGDFTSRFAWYVQAVQSRVAGNWLQSTVDPSISFAPRATVTFDIMRNGQVSNIQVTHSSGNRSVDMSAIRAIQEASPLQPLPGNYSGNYVSVEFWFDFKRQ
jgi:protein TonB